LYNFKDFNFKRHQIIKSEKFISASKRKDIDIADKDNRIYIEYDGGLHFKETSIHSLCETQQKDILLDNHIIKHKWTLIRISHDQFSYNKCNYGFSKECLELLFNI